MPFRMAAPLHVAGPALVLTAVTAATMLAYLARHDLHVGLAPRRALQSATAALPPAQDRLYGMPLRRFRLDDETQEFEPDAYARRDAIGTLATRPACGVHL